MEISIISVCQVFGEKGMLQSANLCPTSTVFTDDEGAVADPFHYDFCTRYNNAYRLELEHFIDVLQGL